MSVNHFCQDYSRKSICDVRNPHEHNEWDGAPQIYPYRAQDSRAVRLAMISGNRPTIAQIARGVRDARTSYERGHNADCRGDLYRGLCH